MDIETLTYQPVKEIVPQITELIKLKAADYAANENGKLLFLVNATNRTNQRLRESRNRQTPLDISRGFTDNIKITYTVPAGYKPDHQLLNIDLHKNFGNYRAIVTFNGNQLTYTRKLQLLDGTYSKDDYNELVNFYESIYDADRYTMALVKNKD